MTSPIAHMRRCQGFGLVEILVAMTIGILGIIIMMQVFSLADAQRRTTTGTSDEETNGAIALYGLQRDIRQAGYGISDIKILGCSLTLRPGISLASLAPATINPAGIPAGDANTDTILLVYANTNGSPQGDMVTTQPDVNIYAVQTPTGYQYGDQLIAALGTRPSSCSLMLDRVVPNSSTPLGGGSITVSTGVNNMANGTLFNLGPAPRVMVYAVRGQNLTVCDYTVSDCSAVGSVGDPSVWVPVASNVVSLRAQYGQDSGVPMSGVVDSYGQSTPTSACGWARVQALRVALVARNSQYEQSTVTVNAPAWLGGAVTPVILSGNADWQHYRYGMFQTLIPLRNVAWMGVQSGC